MDTLLKPCPSCGKVEFKARTSESGLNLHIMCSCRRFSTLWHQTLAACIAEWNDRPEEARLRKLLEAQLYIITDLELYILATATGDEAKISEALERLQVDKKRIEKLGRYKPCQ